MVLEGANKEHVTKIAGGHMLVRDGLDFLASNRSESVDDVVEAIVHWLETQLGGEEFVTAKGDFFGRFGKVFPEDEFYETRMRYFLDWFLFFRSLPAHSNRLGQVVTPFEIFPRHEVLARPGVSARTAEFISALATCRHSLFQVSKVRDDSMQIVDLLEGGAKISIRPKSNESFRAFAAKDVFQGFLFGAGQTVFMSQGLIQHPRSVSSTILKMLKSARKVPGFQAQGILSRLASVQLRAVRHSHVDPVAIYST